MSDTETKAQVEAALRAALAEDPKPESLDAAVAKHLNASGWVVKQITVLGFKDDSYVVSVANDSAETLTVSVKP